MPNVTKNYSISSLQSHVLFSKMSLSGEERKAKCHHSKAVRRAHRGVKTKLIKEADEIILEVIPPPVKQ